MWEGLPIPKVPEAVKALIPAGAFFIWEDGGLVDEMARAAGITLPEMSDEPRPAHGKMEPPPPPKPIEEWPRLLRSIARLRFPSDTGLGDTLQRLFATLGGEWFKAAVKKLGIECGCGDRQAWLNAHYPYPPD